MSWSIRIRGDLEVDLEGKRRKYMFVKIGVDEIDTNHIVFRIIEEWSEQILWQISDIINILNAIKNSKQGARRNLNREIIEIFHEVATIIDTGKRSNNSGSIAKA